MQQGNFIDVFLARRVSGTYAYLLLLLLFLFPLQLALQPLVGFDLLYDFVPQSSIFTPLSPISHFRFL